MQKKIKKPTSSLHSFKFLLPSASFKFLLPSALIIQWK